MALCASFARPLLFGQRRLLLIGLVRLATALPPRHCQARLAITIHDEVRYIVAEEDVDRYVQWCGGVCACVPA